MNYQRKIKDAARNGGPSAGNREKAVAIAELEELIQSLLTAPPEKVEELEAEYDRIRRLIQTIEKDNGHEEMLSSLENDFQRVRRTYPYLTPGFLEQVGTSLLATEYRYFVGGLQIYLKQTKEHLSNLLQTIS